MEMDEAMPVWMNLFFMGFYQQHHWTRQKNQKYLDIYSKRKYD